MPKPRRRGCLTSGYRLDLNQLMRHGLRAGAFRIRFGIEGPEGILSAHLSDAPHNWLRLQLPALLDQTFGLEWVPRNFGGGQWYLHCPLSGGRASC